MQLRKGKFYISKEVIESIGDRKVNRNLLKIMGRCIIIGTRLLTQANAYEYIAYSFDFDLLQDGEQTPTYEWRLSVHPGKVAKRNEEKACYRIVAVRSFEHKFESILTSATLEEFDGSHEFA